MPFTIRYATEQDAPNLAIINIVSFRHQPMWDNLFPSVNIDGVLPLKTARCLDKLVSPQVHVVAAVDDETGQIIGYARWVIPGEPTSVVELSPVGAETLAGHANGKAYPENMRKDVHARFWDMLKGKQESYVQEDDFVLEFLATIPEAQGKGVGTALLRWGLERADARNARVYLEATTDGYSLYRKFGWEDLEEMRMDFTELGGRGAQSCIESDTCTAVYQVLGED
ncbi:acyl-CoA N-acyltransferase [Aspergillus heteromorphus CBS 117.55]|uniref:Acyl-CoA N-acyltransferase n=1 Tax=Aspergillus heteromorphus CBS 117.55 TaxID=1448321 RepID=A0A317WHD4_9EURO|nr:acyl-CoA N-acyltransferase [Aspergillus heteromorphus CBS 117.55]PWY85894.1 acyl-CoA N-acyltransferase [Aspergillus heteromorphus CBS 117.55]